MDQRIKNKGVNDWLGKCTYVLNWAGRGEEKVCLARGPMVSRRYNKEPKKKSSALEEQRIRSLEV